LRPQFVFTPTRLNVQDIGAAYDLAASLGCAAFVTGPLMRIGRAAANWDKIGCSEQAWRSGVDSLMERAGTQAAVALSIYPWDILTEMHKRLESPQAMLLMVPNGKIKLLNALPFAPADLRRDSLDEAWAAYRRAWRTTQVRDFVLACQTDAQLLRHANETWRMENR
jgi:MoaA/NifB/PqqE/SkfB family radical SAM enzyme